MSSYIQNFKKFQPLLAELVARDIKIKYRRSVLGVLWTLLNPLFMMIILSVVFSSIFKFDIENFPLYILSGQLIFNFFNDATTSSMTSIIGSAALIKKVYVPKYLFVIARVFSSFINLMASLVALMLVMVAMRAELHWTVIFSVIPLTMIILFSLGVGMLLAALTVKFRDIMHLYSVFTTGLLYLTPVIYPMSILPESVRVIVNINPLTNMVQMFRDVMFYNTLPSFSAVVLGIAEVAIALVLGTYVFYKNQDEFILNI
ncbi:ABC transporter permease [Mediterraneibacter gnavus]|uniref:ABC transporter permease n=1 Tax=Mediterraneibacter gnavus TaxID=33038 RepID=UPI00232E4F44|nr:ABC transporter permease [Mediterraneibacter gnavus]MDB8710494.1 ABC transporter permease [Mediterraneibacter gnavus]MDB8714078.1 ABC transporter permease [Mediterraneibacter gnavus]